MPPIDPDVFPPGDDPGSPPPDEEQQPKPWATQPTPDESVDPNNEGDALLAVNAAANTIDVGTAVGGAALDAAGTAADAAGSALEGAGSALDAAGSALDGCGGCSLAILITLFAAAGTAMALFR